VKFIQKLNETNIMIFCQNKCKKILLSAESLCDELSVAVADVSFVVSLRFVDSAPDLVSSPRELLGNGLSMRSELTTSVMLNSHSKFGNGRPSDSFCQASK